MISNAPIQTPQLDPGGLPSLSWTGWYNQVSGALNVFNQNGAIPNNTTLYLLASGNQWKAARVYVDTTNHLTIDANTRSSASGSDNWVNTLKVNPANGVLTLNGPTLLLDPTSVTQARFSYSTYPSVLFRNDGGNFFFLLTNNGDPNGSWNALRPFQMDIATGHLWFDQTGAGITFTHPEAIAFGAGFLTWTPTYAGNGGLVVMTSTTYTATYLRVGGFVKFHVQFLIEFSSGSSNSFNCSLPISQYDNGHWECVSCSYTGPGYVWQTCFAIAQGGVLNFFFNGAANWPLGTQFTVDINGVYRCA